MHIPRLSNMKLVLLFLLLPLVANSSSVSSLLLRHQSELTTTTTIAATATLAIDLKQKQLSADRAPDIEQESNQETAQAVLANQELTNAVMASLPGAITNGTNKTTFNDDWKLLEDGVRSKHLLIDQHFFDRPTMFLILSMNMVAPMCRTPQNKNKQCQ